MEGWQQTCSTVSEHFGCHVASAGYTDSAQFNDICTRYRHDYLIIYLHKGSGQVRLNGTWHTIKDNTLLFYRPMDYQEYSFPQEAGRELYWLYFDSISEAEIWEKFHIPSRTLFEMVDNTDFLYVFRRILEELGASHPCKALMLSLYTGQLLLLLSRYAMPISLSVNQNTINHLDAVQEIRHDIETNYMSFVKVNEYALRCGLSTTQFIKLFQRLTDMTPIAYRQKIRLEKAERLLVNTDMSIREIAVATGFQDGLYFSRVFSKKYNISPSVYRKKNRS